jgi:hypothetical protein
MRLINVLDFGISKVAFIGSAFGVAQVGTVPPLQGTAADG